MAQQIKYRLGKVKWESGSLELVFGTNGVLIYAGNSPTEEELPSSTPFALVSVGSSSSDSDHPDHISQTFSVVCAVDVHGDPLGEFAVIGSSTADIGNSGGAGILEVSERVRSCLQNLSGSDGAYFSLVSSGVGSPGLIGKGRSFAYEETNLTGYCTSQPYFDAPQNFLISGGTLSWSGQNCDSRFDFLQFRVGYVGGGTPAASSSVWTNIYTGGSTTISHSPSSNRAYSVVAQYASRGGITSQNESSPSAVGAFRLT